MREFNRAVVIGYGSMGKKHAHFLEPLCETLILVDPKFQIETEVKEATEFQHVETYNDLNDVPYKFEIDDVIVIANWGPDHLTTLELAVQKRAKQIVLEKPCADSLRELDKIWQISIDSELKIAVNQGWFYTNLGSRINKLSTSLELGEIFAIWISGGARCLSTAGSHWVNLANQIYGSNPIELTGHGVSHKINPRGKHLAYVEGVFSYLYPNNKRLSISLTNSSSIAGEINILWRNASGTLGEENIVIKNRNENDVIDKITRYGQPTETLFDGLVPFELNNSYTQMQSLYNTFRKLHTDGNSQNLRSHLDSARAILLSLASAESKKTIRFNDLIEPEFYNRKFLIS
jgi:predicted dehydrogenase